MTSRPLPPKFDQWVGPLPPAGSVPENDAVPFHAVQPARSGFVERDGVKLWYAVWGDSGPWIAFPQPFQIVHSQVFKGTVPYLSQHFRVLTMDGRGNGRSDRPQGQEAYSVDHFHADFVGRARRAGHRSPGRGGLFRCHDDRAAAGRRAASAGDARRHCRGFAESLVHRRAHGPAHAEGRPAGEQRLAGLHRLFHVGAVHRAALDQTVRGRRALWLGHRCRGDQLGSPCVAQQRRARTGAARVMPDAGDSRRRRPARAARQGRGDPSPGARRQAAHHRRRRPRDRGARPRGLQPRGARLRRRCAGQAHLGACDEAPAQGVVHLEPDRPRPRAARSGDRARAAQTAARPGDRLVHGRSRRALPRARGRTAAPADAAAGQREPPRRAAWLASTTCRCSSRCARWTRS